VPAAPLFAAVAELLARLFDATLGSVVRFDAGTAVGDYVGGWSRNATQLAGQTIDLTGNTATARVYRDGRSALVAEYGNHSTDPFLDEFALGGGFAAPITAEGRLWGAVGVAVAAGRSIPVDAQERLASFAELVAVAISSAEALETCRGRRRRTPSPAWPTTGRFTNASAPRSSVPLDTGGRSASPSSISTISSRSTTPMGIRPATACSPKSHAVSPGL
jgi:transcriptional regulator with GAF, ATPase, and Fis domain